MDFSLLARIFSLLSIGSSILIASLLRNVDFKMRVAIGTSIGLMGVIVWADTYLLLPYPVVASIFLLAWFAFTFSLYFASGNNLRSFFLLVPAVLIVSVTILGFSTVILLIAAGVMIASYDAYDYSKLNMSVAMTNADKYLNVLLRPFSIVEKLINKGSPHTNVRLFLSGGYFALDLAILVVLPFALSWISNGILSFEELVLFLLVVWIVVREETMRGLKR